MCGIGASRQGKWFILRQAQDERLKTKGPLQVQGALSTSLIKSILNQQVLEKCAELVIGMPDMDFDHPDIG
jgi:hypothetical protein